MAATTGDRPRINAGLGAGLCIVAAGWAIGLRPLQDNSFLTHLATGRIILGDGVPSTDPYTFTAAGAPWVVQSWLASWLYATVEALAGAAGLRVLMGIIAAAVAAIGWRLLRPAGSLVVRLGLALAFVTASAGFWAERPLMLGLLALGAVMLADQGALAPWSLVPIGWLWTNSHGSFPLGLVYLTVTALGARLDGADWRQPLRSAGWLLAGIALGAVGPLGPRALVFPLELLQRQDVLRNVIEWRSPTFTTITQRAFLVLLVIALLLLVRRPSYRLGLVMAVFVPAALLGVRNVPVAAFVLLPGMATSAPRLGALRASDAGPLGRGLCLVGVAATIVLGAARLDQPDFRLGRYPTDATAFLVGKEVRLDDVRLAAPDFAGNFRELVYGADGTVFYDDRFDMFPEAVSDANLTLVQSSGSVRAVLDQYDIDMVMWPRPSGASAWLAADADWRLLYIDEHWAVSCRRGVDVGPVLGRC